jgi:hypothetical protein
VYIVRTSLKLGLYSVFHCSGKKYLFEFLNSFIRAIKRGRQIEELNDEEIRRLIVDPMELLQQYIDIKPSYDMLLCEKMLIRDVKRSFSDFHREDRYLFIYYVEATLASLMERLQTFNESYFSF